MSGRPWIALGSAAWSGATALARAATRMGWIERERLPCRVISVGNLQAGGAGKTPLVGRIAREAIDRGLRVCILTRGYGGAWERAGGMIAPGDPPVDPALAGDEAALLQLRLPQAWFGIGRERAARFRETQARAVGRFDLAILDDGLQHHRLHRDVDVIAVTSRTPAETLYREARLPEDQAAIPRLVVWTKGEREPRLGRAPDARARLASALLHDGGRGAGSAAELLLLTTIADGAEARASIERAGYRVARHRALGDHARISAGLAAEIRSEASRAGLGIAMTGKDWVKWRPVDPAGPGGEGDAPLVFEPEVELVSGRERWDRVLWGA